MSGQTCKNPQIIWLGRVMVVASLFKVVLPLILGLRIDPPSLIFNLLFLAAGAVLWAWGGRNQARERTWPPKESRNGKVPGPHAPT